MVKCTCKKFLNDFKMLFLILWIWPIPVESKINRWVSGFLLFSLPRNGNISEHFVQQTWTKWTRVSPGSMNICLWQVVIRLFYILSSLPFFFSFLHSSSCCFVFFSCIWDVSLGTVLLCQGGVGIKNPSDMEGRSCSVVLYSHCCQACTHLKSVGFWTWLPDTSSWCGLA